MIIIYCISIHLGHDVLIHLGYDVLIHLGHDTWIHNYYIAYYVNTPVHVSKD